MAPIILPEVVNPQDGCTKALQLDTVLLLRGPGHNLMNERQEGADPASLSLLQTMEDRLAEKAESMGLKLAVAQSNVEGYLINHIHAARSAEQLRGCTGIAELVLSPTDNTAALYSVQEHSYSLYDALIQTAATPFIEVHVGNMYAKEDFRKSVLVPLASGFVVGCGPLGYEMALLRAKELIQERKTKK